MHDCDQQTIYNERTLRNHKLALHQRVKCEECGKEICNTFILRRHKASVHGITPTNAYKCKRCPSFFSTETSLKKHNNSKHGPSKE